MSVKISKPFKYAYEGHRVVEFSKGASLPERDEAAVWALENEHGTKVKAKKSRKKAAKK